MTDEECERVLAQAAKKMADEMMAVACGVGAFTSPRPTAIRVTSWGAFEVVDLDESGKVIEPIRCTCGSYAVYHRPGCPLEYAVS